MLTDNSTKCRDYYRRIKQDPEKHVALKARRTLNQRRRRAALKERVKQDHVKQDVKQTEIPVELL